MAPVQDVDPKDIASSGWGVIFPTDAEPEVEEAMQPLLELRKGKADYLFKVYRYRKGQTKHEFLAEQKAGAGPADPKKVPYYLLIVGDPSTIPFRFQYELDIQYAVGRVHFDHAEDYANYASSVVRVERGNALLPAKQVTLFGVSNQDDPGTQGIVRDLVQPLAGVLRTDRSSWPVRALVEEQATKAQLANLLRGDEAPALLLASGHGLAFPSGDPRQLSEQGALVCHDWPGPTIWQGPLEQGHYFTAQDVPEDARLQGMIAFLLNAYSAGTPDSDGFHYDLMPSPRAAPKPFLSRLAQRLLSWPQGGAQAFVGVLGQFSLSVVELDALESFAKRLLDGHPVGSAKEYFDQRRAELLVELNGLRVDKETLQAEPTPNLIRQLSLAAQSIILIVGDPAVRLHFGEHAPRAADPTSGQNSSPIAEQQITTESKFLSPEVSVGEISGAIRDRVSADDEDQLSFHFYLWALADLINSPDTQPPLTIGIFGSWGMGKSFILKHLPGAIKARTEKNQTPEPPAIVPIEFNAWEYSSSEAVWPALARRTVDEIEKAVKWKRFERMRLKLRRNLSAQLSKDRGWIALGGITLMVILAVALFQSELDSAKLWGALLTLGGIGILKILTDTLNNSLGQWIANLFQGRGYGKPLDLFQQIRDDLGLLDSKLKVGGARALILVDDLDRCEPGKVVEMLQAMHLLLNFESFIVCLAIDARVVTRAVEKHYEGLLGKAGASGYEYLDKIIQIPFRIPSPQPLDVQLFINHLMRKPTSHSPMSGATGGVSASEGKTPQENPPVSAALGGPAGPMASIGAASSSSVSAPSPTTTTFTFDEYLAFARLSQVLRPNPRHLKRLVNVYRLVRSLARFRAEQAILKNPAATVCWIVICAQWPYTAHLIMRELKRVTKQIEETGVSLPVELPLPHLFECVKKHSNLKRQQEFDDDHDLLVELIARAEGAKVGWADLETIQRYTINFNPAIELEWKTEAIEGSNPTSSEASRFEDKV